MIEVTIDGRRVSVAEGATLLEAAREAGAEIPTLCHRDGLPHTASCMLCLVKDNTGRLVPACSTPARDGMTIDTAAADVRDARRSCLELLLSEHLGECRARCQAACPAGMDIPAMTRAIAAGDARAAVAIVKAHIALPAVLGRICAAPCEKACRRGRLDAPVSICLLKRWVADVDLAQPDPFRPAAGPPTGKCVAVIGAGPAGLAAAYYLVRAGHRCRIFDRQTAAGGALRTHVSRDRLPLDVLDAEAGQIARLGGEFVFDTDLHGPEQLAALKAGHDAVVVAAGTGAIDLADALGVERDEQGLRVDPRSLQTTCPGIYAGGSARRPMQMAVRAVADGRRLAVAADAWLRTGAAATAAARFDSVMPPMDARDMAVLGEDADAAERVQPAADAAGGYTEEEAGREARRCLGCDCRKAVSCRLRTWAAAYGANQRRYAAAGHRAFERDGSHDALIYEPGKCIRCGICVRIAALRDETYGVTFLGRGYDMRVGTPFRERLDAALQTCAAECVEACPTGALAMRGEWEVAGGDSGDWIE